MSFLTMLIAMSILTNNENEKDDDDSNDKN